MVPLMRRRATIALALLALGVGVTLAQGTLPAAPTVANPEALQLLTAAESSLGNAEFEQALAHAIDAAKLLATPPGLPRPQGDARAKLARAYDLQAQCYFGMNKPKEMRDAIEQLLVIAPQYQMDRATAGPKLLAILEERRKTVIGTIQVSCTPLPCDQVSIDGEPQPASSDQRYFAPAGDRRVNATRHGFAPFAAPAVRVVGGETTPLPIKLEQIARDLTLVTDPAGVTVSIDGKTIGKTEEAESGTASKPFIVPELEPGTHVVVLNAPCRRRVEQSIDIFIDGQDPGPQTLGPIKLAEARAKLTVSPVKSGGDLLVDGRAVQAGALDICPGVHQVTWLLGGRRAWFAAVDLREGEAQSIAPQPRPTLALIGDPKSLRGFPGDGWNLLPVEGAAQKLASALLDRAGAADEKASPGGGAAFVRLRDEELAAQARGLTPEADLWAIVGARRGALQRGELLVLLHPGTGHLEAISWVDADSAVRLANLIAVRWPASEPFLGFDLLAPGGRAPVVVALVPNGPAASAGLVEGMALETAGGQAIAREDELLALVKPGTELKLGLLKGTARSELTIKPSVSVYAPAPRTVKNQVLLPQLARTSLWIATGEPIEKMAGTVQSALILAALSPDSAAATALDRATLDTSFDPAGDVRGTIGYSLWDILKKLGRTDFAAEVHARWTALPDARLGGRKGPPLRHAGGDR